MQRNKTQRIFQANFVTIFITPEGNPGNLKQIREYIIDGFNVTYSIEAVRQLLIKNGLKLLTFITVPGNPPSEEEQIKTIERYFEMKENSEPGMVCI